MNSGSRGEFQAEALEWGFPLWLPWGPRISGLSPAIFLRAGPPAGPRTPDSVVSPVSVPSCPSRCSVLLPTEESPGVIPGIVGAIVVALGGAISSFIAYQKKKLCFKENGEAAHRHLLSGGSGYRILKKAKTEAELWLAQTAGTVAEGP